jgi:deazaflavin-dependent oxidoreductase (nitroreductase family)
MKRNPLIDLFWRIHPKLYRWSGGRIGSSIMGLPVLLLTTKGRKTGLLRTKALMYIPYGNNFVVYASNLGEPEHPHWWLNLEANQQANVEVKGTSYNVRAREAEGEEREQLWQEVADRVPAYNQYQTRTSRRIPVVVLERE